LGPLHLGLRYRRIGLLAASLLQLRLFELFRVVDLGEDAVLVLEAFYIGIGRAVNTPFVIS